MSSNQTYSTNLISDAPATADKFGSHKRVAEAMARLISSNEGGKSIGLEGGWGSGKSTVINLLISELEKNPNYTVVEFDAWAHEGDPLRRTFLENLISRLLSLKWINRSDWEEKLEIIRQRKEIKTTSTIPYLTFWGKVLVCSIVLIPLGVPFLNAALKDPPLFTFNPNLPLPLQFIKLAAIGFLFTLFPLWVLALAWLHLKLRKLISWLSSRRQRLNLVERDDKGSQLLAMLFNKTVTEAQTVTNKTPNPTSIEFEGYFRDLMREALLDQNGNVIDDRKVILVLDNLDRIAAEEALSLWSTLQTFLRHRHNQVDGWFNRLWIIIPYDLEGLKQLWDKGEDGDNKDAVALSFLDKSFQIRFEVPPPVLSDWHDYLLDLLKEAFPDHTPTDFHTPYKLYAWYLNEKKQLPTPRGLKLYVNQIGSIYRQWGRTFPLSHIAYYVLLRRLDRDVVSMLLQGQLPESDVAGFLGTDARDHLAALAFNVEVEKGRQIILHNPIKEAIALRDTTKLAELQKSHSGFWEALETIAEEEWSKAEVSTIADVAYCLEESGLLRNATRLEAQTLISALRKNASAATRVSPFTTEVATGIAALCKLIPEAPVATNMLKAITADLLGEKAKEQSIDVSTWVNAMRLVVPALQSLNLAEAFTQGVLKPITDRLRVTNTLIPINELNTLLLVLCDLRDSGTPTEQFLSKLAEEGYILHHMDYVIEPRDTNPELIARCAYVFLSAFPNAAKPQTVGESEKGYAYLRKTIIEATVETYVPEVVEKFSNHIERYQDLNLLLSILQQAPESKYFIGICLRLLFESEKAPTLFPPDVLINRWPIISYAVKNYSFKALVEKTTLLDDLSSMGFDLGLVDLYAAVASPEAVSNERFRGFIISGLQSISKQDWKDWLINGDDLTALVQKFIIYDVKLDLGENYLYGLIEHGKAAIDGKIGSYLVAEESGSWQMMASALATESDRMALRKGLLEAVARRDGDVGGIFFEMWGKEIANAELLRDNPETLEKLYISFSTKGNERGMAWLRDVLESDPDLLSGYDIDTITKFRTRSEKVDVQG